MSYDGQTPVLKLPQWVMSDELEVGDLNAAFSLLDDFAGTIPQTASVLQNRAAVSHDWIPVLEQDGSAVPIAYSQQQGWYASLGRFALIACAMRGTFSQAPAGEILVAGLPAAPAEGFHLPAYWGDIPVQVSVKNGGLCFTLPDGAKGTSLQALSFTCAGLLPL